MLTQNEQIFKLIKDSKNILITFTNDWNGDAIASALAMQLFLKKINKQSDIIADKLQQKSTYNFLPTFNNINLYSEALNNFIISVDISNIKIKNIKYKIENNFLKFIISPEKGALKKEDIVFESDKNKYDLIITLDSPDLESLGKIYEYNNNFFYQTPLINISNKTSNEGFGQINKIDISSVSTTEILFNLFNKLSKDLINDDIATCLMAGIIFKTENFKTQNITPQLLSSSSQLISIGARREEIVNKIYRSRSFNTLKLWGRALAKLSSELDNKLIWTTITENDFIKTNTNKESLNDIINELIINIPNAEIIILLYESEQETSVIIYSPKNINANEIVKQWNPRGTKYSALINLKKQITEAEEEIIPYLKNKLINLKL